MKKIFLIITLIVLSGMSFAQENEPPAVVDSVDLAKYTGLWYEIARIPNFFQDDCLKNTTAEYSLQVDGSLKVINTCVEEDGEINRVEGVARVADSGQNSKLEVSFVKILGINLFWGDYWIIGLDKDYKWAIVGHPERKYGWILSRSKTLEDSTKEEILNLLSKQGYKIDEFKFGIQD